MANPIAIDGTHYTQERYSPIINKLLRKRLVTNEEDIFSVDYEGTPTAGAVQVPVRDSEVTVADYDIKDGIALTQSATTYLTLTVNKNKAVNELIDGYEADAVPDNLAAQRVDSATYSLQKTLDDDAIAELEAGGTTSTNTTASTSSTAYSNILDEQVALDLADVPRDGRFIIVEPSFLPLLKKDANFVSAGADTGFNEVKKAGLVGMVDGAPVYMSNSLATGTEFIIGHKAWCQRVREWAVEPKLVSLEQSANYVGASAIKGRYIYLHKVTRATCVRVKTAAA